MTAHAAPTFPVRYHLMLLVALATVPILFFAGRIVADLGREQRLSVEQGLQATARALAIAVEREIEASTRSLEVLATAEALARDDLRAFHAQVVRAVAVNELWYIAALTDARGQLLLASTHAYGEKLPFIGDRPYISTVLREARPAVSDLIVGRTTGRLNITVGVPVRGEGGVRYVLFAGINPEALGRIMVVERIPPTWIAALADTRQTVVARNRAPERFVGEALGVPIGNAVRAAPEGTGRFAVRDGPEVYAAWQRTPSLGWTVTLGAPVAMVDASLRRSMWTITTIGIAVALGAIAVALAVGLRIAAAMGKLTGAATVLAQGEIPTCPPSTIAEVTAVGRALETAGRTIKARTEELIASQATVKHLVDSNLIGILVGEGARIVDANAAFLRLVGYTREDLVEGRLRWPSLTPPGYEAADAAAIAEARATGEAAAYEKEYVRKDGTRVPVLVGAAFVDDSRRRWVGFVLDLTERKRVEAERKLRFEAEAANRMKDEFLAIVSHELRTPLATVLTSVRAVRSGRLAAAETRAAMERIERNTRLQARLIDDLLDLSRIVAGKLRVERKPIPLEPIVREAVAVLGDEAERQGVKLVTIVPPTRGLVLGDPERLQQVVLNLVGNAIKFTPPGGTVSVVVAARDGKVVLTVHDTGIGIDPALLPDLFEAFRQGVAARAGGLGLGLAIVRRLVDMHGGTVRAESRGPGTGALFTVELPIVSA